MDSRTILAGVFLWLALFSFATSAAEAPDKASYLIQPGDQLQIDVWHEEELRRELVVRPDGGISFPLVGDLIVQGTTPVQLTEILTHKLSRYIPDPVVTVTVAQASGNRLYVIGEVARPGEFPMSRPVTVLQALAMAGGFTPYAKRSDIKVLRGHGNRQTVLPFDYSAVASGENLRQNIELKPGDVVLVP